MVENLVYQVFILHKRFFLILDTDTTDRVWHLNVAIFHLAVCLSESKRQKLHIDMALVLTYLVFFSILATNKGSSSLPKVKLDSLGGSKTTLVGCLLFPKMLKHSLGMASSGKEHAPPVAKGTYS